MKPAHPRLSRLAEALQALRTRIAAASTRSFLALLLAGGAAAGLLFFVDRIQPIRHWFAGTMGIIFAWQLLANVAWVGIGLTITRRLFPASLPRHERLVISAAVGAVTFAFALYVLGALRLFNPTAAVFLAVGLSLVGLPELRRWWRERPLVESPSVGEAPLRGLGLAASVFGVFGVGVIYLGLLTPDAVNYDARWMHLTIAQDYAREGRLVSFPGDYVKSYPHLASILHTWDFLVPGLTEQPARWMMALHTEFALFLWTLAGVAAAVRWLAADFRIRGAWAAFFLFPGIFVYDSNMGGAADHALAFFVLPLFLLSVRLPWQSSTRAFALWGIVAGGALLTKFQATYVFVPVLLLLIWGVLRAGGANRTTLRTMLRAGVPLVAAFVIVTAPHFIKNWIYHANPTYPLLQEWFTGSHPAVRDSPLFVRTLLADHNWRAPEAIGPRITEALKLVFTFAFDPHYSFANQPTFGFLFTLSLPLLLVVPGGRHLWAGALVSLTSVFFWAFTYRVDRNLQIFLPILVATTAAILIRAWRTGWLARVGVGALVLLQIAWGGDIWFWGTDRIGGSLALIHSSIDGQASNRFTGMSADYLGLERALPKDAIVLLHHWHPTLGINRRVYLDWVGFQGAIDYRTFATPRALYDRLRTLGVTHVVHLPGNQAAPSRQEDAIFSGFVIGHPGPKSRIGMFELFPLSATPPPERSPLQVLALGVGGYADGLFDVTSLGTVQNLPAALLRFAPPKVRLDTAGAGPLLDASDVVLVGGSHAPDSTISARLMREYQAAVPYPGLTVYVRNPNIK